MKLALFGAGGFVGSNLSNRLQQDGAYEPLLLDIWDNKLKLRFGNRPFEYEHCDISKDISRVDEVVAGTDTVVHLAAHVHPRHFLENPLEIVQLNFFDALNVIDACVKHNKRLIHFSTSEVYGKARGSDEPFKEDETDLILGPINSHRWIYSCGKQFLDRIIHAHGLAGNLEYTILRPFNFFGPLMDELVVDPRESCPRVFAHFMSALMYGRPLQLVDGGKSRRCFTYIEDATAAIQAIIDNPEQTKNEIINIGIPSNEISIEELAHKMRDIYTRDFDPSCDVPIESVDSQKFYGPGYEDCDRRLPDNSKLMALGWEPQYDLDRALPLAMRYFYDNREQLEVALAG